MSFYSVHGYYDDDFIMESGTFENFQDAQDLCNLLNNSNTSNNIIYVIVESKTLDNYPIFNTYTNTYSERNYTNNTNTHIFFNEDFDLGDNQKLDFEMVNVDETLDDSLLVRKYDSLNNIKIKKYGVGYIFDCNKNDINDFVKNQKDIKIYFLKHIRKYFFRKSQMEKVLSFADFNVTDEILPFPKNLLASSKLCVDVDGKKIKCSKDYIYKNDYYFIGGWKSKNSNCWNFKHNAFNNFLNHNTLIVQNNQ